MFAANGSQPFLEPIHYVEETPPEIVSNYKPTTKRSLTSKNIIRRKKINPKGRKHIKIAKIRQLENYIKTEAEISLHNSNEDNEKNNAYDPLFTPSQILVKCEINEEKVELDAQTEHRKSNKKISKSNEDSDFSLDEHTEDDAEEDEYGEENESAEDEFLVVLSKNSQRGTYKKTKIPSLKACRNSCKLKCSANYNDQQRIDIFNYYWQLSKEEKVNFMREHIRKQLAIRSRRTQVRHNCCYFLKNYKIENISNSEQPPQQIPSNEKIENSFCDNTEEGLTKVCRTFFNGTLRISNQEIKEAFKNFELKPEKMLLSCGPIAKDETENASIEISKKEKMPKVYLDPETGALTDTKPKKKYKKRKRDEPPPKRFPKPVRCTIRCKFNCAEKFTEEDRAQICDIFWSLDFKRRKDFVLSRIETEDVKAPTNPEFRKTNRPIRSYQTKFYLRAGPKSENVRVCKHFMENTLCVHPKFVDDAIKFSDKKTGAYTGFDRRGCNVPHNKTPVESKQTILNHINSYPFWIPNKKSKIKYLHYSLAIKKMHEAYKEKCLAAHVDPLTARMYYKVFHEDFHILFLSNPHPKKGRGYYKTNPNISHYTGDEAGGCWFDIHGNKLDLRYINPALPLDVQQNNVQANTRIPSTSSTTSQPSVSGFGDQGLNLVYNPSRVLPFVASDINSSPLRGSAMKEVLKML